MITVFTPAYNRAYTLGRLYDSLCRQTFRDFEWLVVDDGSTDKTEQLIAGFIAEQRIPIRYIRKVNGGKHTAINLGVKEARGELFFIVDSDDYLIDNALEGAHRLFLQIAGNQQFAGISGVCARADGSKVGGEEPWSVIDATALEIRNKYHVKGDLSEIYKTEILKQFPFPEFDDERFSPEALVWNRIAKSGYKLRYVNKGIYICEYLGDGLTAAITRVRIKSPKAMSLYYSEYFHCHTPLREKVKTMINYWRFSPYYKHLSFSEKVSQIGICSLLFFPVALLMYHNDKKSLAPANA
jgi:glycosyltransferase involved in cell wall biosynthesis